MNNKKTLLKVFNETDSDTTELYLHGPIRDPLPDESEEDVIQLKEVRKKLNKITTDNIITHLNTTGGDLFQSVTIHNLLKNHSAENEIIVDGVAASGGSVIAMAGDKIRMYKNTSMMIHLAHTITYGNTEDHREAADKLDKLDKSLIQNYLDRFTGSKDELKEMLKEETWLTAQEAKELGFCDEIIDDTAGEGEVENHLNQDLFNKLKVKSKVKDKLLRKYGEKNEGNKLFKNFQ